ncbi:MAG: sensor domain-containing diguanylate cyclase [Anaerolineae bacterium]|nr:sensor domain-containing diguanylate cyclase [Anaerolineae bacterium]MCI0607718.1 sensor domain-containing diguanylate cyclase [Anaerolineae bacterium]
MGDNRLKILAEARGFLEKQGGSASDRETLLKLLDILTAALERYSPEDIPITQGIARELINNRALLAMLKQQTDELDALKKLSINLTSSLDLPDVLDAVVSEAVRLIENARDVNIFLYRNYRLSFGAALDSDGVRNKPFSKPRSNGLTYTVARQGEIIIVEDMRNHPLFATAPKDWSGSIIAIPLKVGDAVVGVMNLSRLTLGGFSPSELRLLSLLSDQAAVAISNASLHQMISRQAYSDTLTGLPNRRALDERLEEEVQSARRNNYSFAVIMMDLDGFKEVNDTYGHSVGDDVLRLVFNQMARGVRNTDFLARYGGDELTLILTQSDMSSAQIVAEKIVEGMGKLKYKLPDGRKLKLGISGGIAIFPVNARNGPDMLRAADAALYQAKKHKRGAFEVARGITGPLATHRIGGE